MPTFANVVRREFPGKSNFGLRQRINRCKTPEDVRCIARVVALTAQGKAGLEIVARSLESSEG